ncbi:MAG: ROK family protein, partial [Cyclobacteriaceae bacterium]|nr:ROK family protein [Cyclobacteriaceae bacterium]
MKKVTIGIDIGGTSTKYGLTDREGKIYFQGDISTRQFDEVTDYVKALANRLKSELSQYRAELVGIGVGAANGNYYKGTIEHATNLK